MRQRQENGQSEQVGPSAPRQGRQAAQPDASPSPPPTGGHPPAPTSTRALWRKWQLPAALLALVAVGLAAYGNSFDGVFLYDDLEAIRDNPHIPQLWPLSENRDSHLFSFWKKGDCPYFPWGI